MKTIERSVIAVVAAGILLLFLFPPFMCIEAETGGRVHAALGYYPIWKPPSPETAFHELYPNVQDIPTPDRLAAFIPKINKVRLAATVLGIALAGSLVILVLRKRV